MHWAALAVSVAAAERLGLERSPLWEQPTGLAVLAAATALHRTWPATAFLLAAAPGIATSLSHSTLSYGSALAVFAFLLGRRGTATGAALLSNATGTTTTHTPRATYRVIQEALALTNAAKHAPEPPRHRLEKSVSPGPGTTDQVQEQKREGAR